MDAAQIKIGLELAAAAKKLLPKKDDAKLNDDVCKALRSIYFMPHGVLSLLKDILAGEKLSEDRLRSGLVEFNDAQWEVQRNLQGIDFDRMASELGLTLATVKKLRLIALGKIDLRRSIQEEINYYGQRGVKPNLEKLERFVAQIETLNETIEALEEKLNVRARLR